MSFRGRGGSWGRGRGRGFDPRQGSTFQKASHLPYVLFPDSYVGSINEVDRDTEKKMNEYEKASDKEKFILPELPEWKKLSDDDKKLFSWSTRFGNFWKGSCYHLDAETQESKKRDVEAEWFSNKAKRRSQHAKHEDLSFYLKLSARNFPAELVEGSKRVKHDKKKLRWDPAAGGKTLELFEKLEESEKGLADEAGKKKENESDDEDAEEDDAEEESSDDDYNKNEDFDDDEDDLNMDDGEGGADDDYYE